MCDNPLSYCYHTLVLCRTLITESILKVGASFWISSVRYQLGRYSNVVTFNNTDGSSSWNQRTSHKASWFTGLRGSNALDPPADGIRRKRRFSGDLPQPSATLGRQLLDGQTQTEGSGLHAKRPARRMTTKRLGRMWDGRSADHEFVITQNARHYSWVNVGGQYDMAPYVFSFNETLQAPSVFTNPEAVGGVAAVVITGRQTHYQQATMVDVYDTKKPACTIPSESTHSVVMHHSIGITGSESGPAKACKAWNATCAFCSPSLLVNEFSVTDCSSLQRSG